MQRTATLPRLVGLLRTLWSSE